MPAAAVAAMAVVALAAHRAAMASAVAMEMVAAVAEDHAAVTVAVAARRGANWQDGAQGPVHHLRLAAHK